VPGVATGRGSWDRALSTPKARSAYLRRVSQRQLAGAPETDKRIRDQWPCLALPWPYVFDPFGSDVGLVEGNGRYGQVLLARGRFEFDHEFSRYSPTLFHLYALDFGPFTDLGGVQAAR